MLQYRILGPLEVSRNGLAIGLSAQRPRALLALLLLNANRVVATDMLIDALWNEQPPRNATTSLQNGIVQLRKLLGAEVVERRAPGYVLHAEREQIDASLFEGLVERSRTEATAARASTLREALALWRGAALADLSQEQFAQPEIRRLEELRLAALEERVDADIELGGGRELVGELEALVARHPVRERLRGQLMLALYRSDRQAEALQAYHDARRSLLDELGIEPSTALQQLYRLVLRQEASLERAPPPKPREDHLAGVVKALLGGQLVVVLGAGVNHVADGLPGPTEVAAHLARSFECPPEHARDLAQVAEYVALTKGTGPLYDELHSLFARDCAPRPIDHGLVQLAALLRDQGAPGQLIVTTNFDCALEAAFQSAGEDVDVVSYLAVGRNRGKFLHLGVDGGASVVEVPNAYAALSLERRTVLLKLHGGIGHGPDREWESFVVSEDDHIDHLAQAEISVVIPVTLAARLRRSHFLFLGYPLEDWGLRVFLHRVWGRERVGYRSWAVGPRFGGVEYELWRERGIESVEQPLDEYVAGLISRVIAETGARAAV